MEFGNKYRAILERKTKDELHGIAKVLQVSGFRKLSKDSLVTAILRTDDRDTLSGLLSRSWWRRHHNHVYGGAGILSLVLGVIFFLIQRSESREPSEDSGSSLSTSSVDDRSEVPQSNQDSSSSFAPDDGELKAQVASKPKEYSSLSLKRYLSRWYNGTDLQRDELEREMMGKTVIWTGAVASIESGRDGGIRVVVRPVDQYGSAFLDFPASYKATFLDMKVGRVIKFTGTIHDRVASPFLVDCELLEILD